MDYNYHTHTKYCNHATGEMEDYVKQAIAGGIRYMGFSEHSPFRFPDGFETAYHRIFIKDVPTYLQECHRLKELYKEKIDLKIGYEMEYYPLYFPQMLKMALDFDAEYLILGQHYLQNEYPNGYPSGVPTEDENTLKEYVECVLAGMKTGVFTYVAHPDFVNYRGSNDALYEAEMEKICLASKEYNIPLELNFGGARCNENYPSDKFFKIAGRIGCPITFGMDAHSADAAFDKQSLEKGMKMVKTHNLNYIGMPKLVLLNEQKATLYQKFNLNDIKN